MSFRVSLLSPRSVRIEFSLNDIFCDGPSFFFIERGEASPWLELRDEYAMRVFVSDNFEIKVNNGADDLSHDVLKVSWHYNGKSGEWHPGDIDTQNLGASFSSLDNCNRYTIASGVHDFDPLVGQDSFRSSPDDVYRAMERELRESMGVFPEQFIRNEEMRRFACGEPLQVLKETPSSLQNTYEKIKKHPPGFLSRSGLTIIRDTGPMWDSKKEWFVPRPDGHIDLTFIACGDDFKGTLGEIACLAGPIPLLPRWALGVWFSCYRRMGPMEFKETHEGFKSYHIPLNVLVVDTDWHEHKWHGFDWNRDIFPEPDKFFSWLKSNNLHNTFNVHPGFIPKDDSRLEEYRHASGSDALPLTLEEAPHPLHSECVPVDLMNKREADAWFEVFHRPLLEQGCDMWWIDGATKHWDGGVGTAWLNHLYFKHQQEVKGESVPAFSRASGLGCHRSTLAFSGDAWVEWETLGQEVESTIRGACVLMAWWSHDIGGFWFPDQNRENKPDDDLFIRWTQFGCLSPIMRYHSDHGVREPWLFETQTMHLCREALLLRKQLEPVFAALMHEAHETGVAPWRPMCFEFPEENESYKRWRQVMIGEQLLFIPVVDPDGRVDAWFPPGKWKHMQTKEIIEGPVSKSRYASIEEIPLFSRI